MIHPTAIIEPGAQLGTDVRIGPLAYVAATAVLGDGCVLAPHAV
nr:acyl-[acyl-carrier-protein]--UDP-N-acetylglucosamine O-acyltransferase [Kiritimatiellia bacterium]